MPIRKVSAILLRVPRPAGPRADSRKGVGKPKAEGHRVPLARCAAVIPPPPLPAGRSSCQGGFPAPVEIPPVRRAERAKERPWAGSYGDGSSRRRAVARAAAWALLSAVGGGRRIAGPQSCRAGRPLSAPALWGAWLTPGASTHAQCAWPGWTPGIEAPLRPKENKS